MYSKDIVLSDQIVGLHLTSLFSLSDSRGSIKHIIKNSDPLFFGFGETYYSSIKPNKAKAWKLHRIQTQNLVVVSGQLKCVVLENTCATEQKKRACCFILDSAENYMRATIKPWLWYGFKNVGTKEAIIINMVDTEHNPDESINKDLFDENMPFELLGIQKG